MITTNPSINSHDVLIGVLLTRQVIIKMRNGIIGDRIARLQKANEKAQTTLYFFSIQDVDMDKFTIDGMYYDNEIKNWTNKPFSFPMVLYNRGGVSRNLVVKYNNFQQVLAKRGTKYLNYDKGFNKWEIYNQLLKVESLRPYLPYTQYYTNYKDLDNMLKKYDKVYLKACRGRKGYHVMRIIKLQQDRYQLDCITRNKNIISYQVNFQSILKAVNIFFRGRNFIIQQAIDLPVVDDKILDMRAEVQRNGLGKLDFTSICVRLSQPNSPVTTHGESYRLEDFFDKYSRLTQEDIKMLRKKIECFLYSVYTGVEGFYGKIGEIGIDFALDRSKNIWLIECNSRPTKVSLLMAYDEDTAEKAFLNPLEYAKYLISNTQDQKQLFPI